MQSASDTLSWGELDESTVPYPEMWGEPSHDVPPEEPKVISYDVCPETEEPKEPPQKVDEPSGEDVPPTIQRQKQKIIRRWNLDRTMKVIAGPEGLRFLSATDFTLSAEEWQTWCEEWRSDTIDIVLSEDRDEKCTLLRTEYGLELKRKRGLKTTKFYLSEYQIRTLDFRACYITAHLELLRENAVPIHIMKSVVASKLMEMAAKLNMGMTYPSIMEETFDEVLENAVSLGITSEVLRDFSSEMRIRGIYCGLDSYSVFFYCMFQLSELRAMLM